MTDATTPDVLTERRGDACWITLNRPERKNCVRPGDGRAHRRGG